MNPFILCATLLLSIGTASTVDLYGERGDTVKLQFEILFNKATWCDLIFPDGRRYGVHPHYNVSDPKVEKWYDEEDRACEVGLKDLSFEYVGAWKMVGGNGSVGLNQTSYVHIEEKIDAIPAQEIHLIREQAVLVGLSESLKELKEPSCKVTSPSKREEEFKPDTNGMCLYNILSTSQKNDSGEWSITGMGHDNRVKFMTKVTLDVLAHPGVNSITDLLSGSSVELVFGHKDALYCQYRAPASQKWIRHQGQCVVKIDLVNKIQHDGIWYAEYGLPTSMSKISVFNYVNVFEIDGYKKGIIPYVNMSGNDLEMSCILPNKSMSTCRFIRFDGEPIFINNHIGVDRYEYFQRDRQHPNSSIEYAECGLRIRNPEAAEKLPWKCAIVDDDGKEHISWVQTQNYTTNETVGSFISVSKNISTVLEESVDLLCEYSKPISYCWFLSPNNSRISLSETEDNDHYQYIGDGFQSGHCGIRIKRVNYRDRGNWKCNVGNVFEGLLDSSARINIVKIYDTPIIGDYARYKGVDISCSMYDNSPVEYCRFVRPDGVGVNPLIIGDSVNGIESSNETDLSKGICKISLSSSSLMDYGVWRCFMKPYHSNVEYQEYVYIYSYYGFNNDGGSDAFLWVIIVIGVAGILCLVRLLYVRYRQIKRGRTPLESSDNDSVVSGPPLHVLAVTTENNYPVKPEHHF